MDYLAGNVQLVIAIFGNSLYYYSNATFYEENPNKLYNDLKFIGTFKDPRKKYR